MINRQISFFSNIENNNYNPIKRTSCQSVIILPSKNSGIASEDYNLSSEDCN